MCRFILLSVCILILSLSVKANYVRITRDLSIADQEIYDTHVNVNFSIAWDNSWRDDFNWDAVYIFLKCRRKNEVVWQHVCLRPDYHRVSNGYEYMLASNGTKECMPGLFIFSNRNGRCRGRPYAAMGLQEKRLLEIGLFPAAVGLYGDVHRDGVCAERFVLCRGQLFQQYFQGGLSAYLGEIRSGED